MRKNRWRSVNGPNRELAIESKWTRSPKSSQLNDTVVVERDARKVLAIELVGTFRRSAAKNTRVPFRVGFPSARRAIKLLDSNFAIHAAITGIDLEDLAVEILFLKVGALPKKLPHGLAGKRKTINASLKIIDRSGGTVNFRFRTLGKSLCACDSRLLIRIPKHGCCVQADTPKVSQAPEKRKPGEKRKIPNLKPQYTKKSQN